MSHYSDTILADNPQAYYRAGESAGLVAFDQTANHYDASLSSGITLSQAGAISGDSDTAMLFGATSMLSLPYTLNPSTWSALSLEFWIKQTGVYHHVVITADSASTLTYLDGALFVSGAGDPVLIDTDIYWAGSYNSGDLDEIALYNYVLTPTQILHHYLVGSVILSGGFALYANGTGVASFDDFRVTAYPDPALALELVGRLGSSVIGWNANLPSATTTLGMYTSIRGDGSDWIDVSAQSGGPIPGLFGQPDPIIDGFDSDTTGLYTSTHNNDGTDATWAVNTAKSRIEVTGGVEPVLIYNGIARADMTVETITDQAPGNGMGLACRWIDGNNTYNLYIQDKAALSPNTWLLYKIVADVYTLLASGSLVFPRGTFHVFRLSTIGSTISAMMDGVQLASVTDTSITGPGQAGLIGGHGADQNRFYSLRIQPLGDLLLNTYVYTKQVPATTDATVTGQLLDMTVAAFNPNIGPGALIPAEDDRHLFADKILDDKAKQSGDYSWWIDQNFQFHFNKRTAVPAPWVLYSVPFGVASAVDLEADNTLKVTMANDMYRNRQTLTGVINSGTFSDTFIGDSNTTSFTLRYPIAPGTIPVVKLNGVAQSVAQKGQSGAQWYYAPGDLVIAQDAGGTVLANTDVLTTPNYTGTFEDSITVDNLAAQQALAVVMGPLNTGIVENVEDVSSRKMSYASGLVYAGQLLARWCIKDARTIVFTTKRNGLAVGQIQSMFIPEENLWDAQMLITSIDPITIQTQPLDTILYTYVVTASELPPIASWSKLFGSGLLL